MYFLGQINESACVCACRQGGALSGCGALVRAGDETAQSPGYSQAQLPNAGTCILRIRELAWRIDRVMDCHVTALGSIPGENGVKTERYVLCNGQQMGILSLNDLVVDKTLNTANQTNILRKSKS